MATAAEKLDEQTLPPSSDSLEEDVFQDDVAPLPTSDNFMLNEVTRFMSDLSNATKQDSPNFALPVRLIDRLKDLQVKLADRKPGVVVREKLTSMRRRVITGNPNKRVRDFVKEEPVVRTIDKISFSCGVTGLLLIQHFMSMLPEYFGLFYCMLMIPLLITRYYLYSSLGWQYFLVDFCYMVNWLTMITIVYPDFLSGNALRICFVMGNGPLTWAIVAWRNSLVFHSLDKITSVYIHILPALVTFVWRWTPGNPAALESACPDGVCSLTMMEWLIYPLAFYLLWQVFYLWYTEVKQASHLNSNESLTTSLRWLAKSPNGMALSVMHLCRRVGIMKPDEVYDPKSMKTKLIFVFSQLVFTVATILPTKFYFESMWLHLGYLLCVYLACLWNGAAYYIHVFSKRYIEKFPRPAEQEQGQEHIE